MPGSVVKAANVARLREHAVTKTDSGSAFARVPTVAWIIVGVAVLALALGAFVSARVFSSNTPPSPVTQAPTPPVLGELVPTSPPSLAELASPSPAADAGGEAGAPTTQLAGTATRAASVAATSTTSAIAAVMGGAATATPPAPARTIDLMEVTDSHIGRRPVLDRDSFVRIQEPSTTFQLADGINAAVYLRRKGAARDLTFPIAYRWEQVRGTPLELTGTQDWPRNLDAIYLHTCAPAAALDRQGTNTALHLEALIEDEVIQTFTFYISGGTLPSASSNPCDSSAIPRG